MLIVSKKFKWHPALLVFCPSIQIWRGIDNVFRVILRPIFVSVQWRSVMPLNKYFQLKIRWHWCSKPFSSNMSRANISCVSQLVSCRMNCQDFVCVNCAFVNNNNNCQIPFFAHSLYIECTQYTHSSTNIHVRSIVEHLFGFYLTEESNKNTL